MVLRRDPRPRRLRQIDLRVLHSRHVRTRAEAGGRERGIHGVGHRRRRHAPGVLATGALRFRHQRHAVIGRERQRVAIAPHQPVQRLQERVQSAVEPHQRVLELVALGPEVVSDLVGRGEADAEEVDHAALAQLVALHQRRGHRPQLLVGIGTGLPELDQLLGMLGAEQRVREQVAPAGGRTFTDAVVDALVGARVEEAFPHQRSLPLERLGAERPHHLRHRPIGEGRRGLPAIGAHPGHGGGALARHHHRRARLDGQRHRARLRPSGPEPFGQGRDAQFPGAVPGLLGHAVVLDQGGVGVGRARADAAQFPPVPLVQDDAVRLRPGAGAERGVPGAGDGVEVGIERSARRSAPRSSRRRKPPVKRASKRVR